MSINQMGIWKSHFIPRLSPRQVTMNRLLRIFLLFLLLVLCTKANEEQICNDNECYPRIFVPKEEFQAVREGQEIPKGI